MSHRRAKRVRQVIRQAVANTLGVPVQVAKDRIADDIQHRQIYRRVKHYVSANRKAGGNRGRGVLSGV